VTASAFKVATKIRCVSIAVRPVAASVIQIMGFATMRLDQIAFGELAGAVAEAMRKLERAPRQVH
jgi:hypothetical protein